MLWNGCGYIVRAFWEHCKRVVVRLWGIMGLHCEGIMKGFWDIFLVGFEGILGTL